MPADLQAPATVRALLDERPTLSRAASLRALDEIVAQERVRQDGRMAALHRLREEADRILASAAAPAPTAGIGARLRTLLSRRRRARAGTEQQLRARYEDAQLRARRAFAFAETLAELARELGAEDDRVRALLAELQRDDATLDELIRRLRACDAEHERALERAREHELLRDGVRAAEDRLLRLLEGERMLLVRVSALRAEVERTARLASERLDDMGATLRGLATREDSERVLADLERSLGELVDALDASARQLRHRHAEERADEGADPSAAKPEDTGSPP